jgi:glycosyltransferase involved in cell wall biosynthesis/ADP-heptose:LPS heptosyltransferase
MLSVILANYNREKYLEKVFSGLLSQRFQDFELIVVDDGSTDNSVKIIERNLAEFSGRNTFFRFEKNIGQGMARASNKALSLATRKYVAVQDSDDVSCYNRFSSEIEFLEDNPEIVLVGSHAIVINENNQIQGKWTYPPETNDEIIQAICDDGVNPIIHPSVMYRRDIIWEKFNGYNPEQRFAPDFDLYRRLILGNYNIANLQKLLVRYRLHRSQITRENTEACAVEAEDIVRRFREELPNSRRVLRSSPRVQSIEHLEKPRLVFVADRLQTGGLEKTILGILKHILPRFEVSLYFLRTSTNGNAEIIGEFRKVLGDRFVCEEVSSPVDAVYAFLKKSGSEVTVFFSWQDTVPEALRRFDFRPKCILVKCTTWEGYNSVLEKNQDIIDTCFTVSPKEAEKPNFEFLPTLVDEDFVREGWQKRRHKDFTFGYCGRLDEDKGIPQVLKIAEKTRSRIALMGAAGNISETQLVKAVYAVGLSNKFELIQPGLDVGRLWSQIDVNVLLSVVEGLPLSVLEAAYCGIPSVVTPVGAMPELFQDSVNIFFVRSAEEYLTRWPEIRSRYKTVGENAQLLVRERYLARDVADRFVELVQSIDIEKIEKTKIQKIFRKPAEMRLQLINQDGIKLPDGRSLCRGDCVDVSEADGMRLLEKGYFREVKDDVGVDFHLISAKEPKKFLDDTWRGKRICLISPGGFGDVLIIGGVAEELKKNGCSTGMAVPKEKMPLVKTLRAVDRVVDLGQWESDQTYKQFDYSLNFGTAFLDEKTKFSATDYYRKMLDFAGLSVDSVQLPRLEIPKTIVTDLVCGERKLPEKYVVIHTGSTFVYRLWNSQSWRKLVEFFTKRRINVVFLGKNDFEFTGEYVYSVSKYDFVTQMAVVNQAEFFIGVDSVFTHVAGLTKRPGLVLFGPSSSAAVIGNYESLSPVFGGEPLDCRPCCTTKLDCPIDAQCMRDITPEIVFEKVPTELQQKPCVSGTSGTLEKPVVQRDSGKTKKICFLLAGLPMGGAEMATWAVAKELIRRKNVDVTIASFLLTGDSLLKLFSRDFKSRFVGLGRAFTKENAIKFLAENKFDIVLYYTLQTELVSLLSDAPEGTRIIRLQHTETENERTSIGASRDLDDLTISVSPRGAERVKNGVFIPNGVETSRFLGKTQYDFGWDEKLPTLGYIGRIDATKGTHGLLDIVEQVDCNLAIVGFEQETQKRYFTTKLKTMKNSHRVRLLTRTDNVASIYRALNFYVLLSNSEGMPLGVLEAGYCGVPSITTRVGALPRIFEHGKNIIFINSINDIAGSWSAILGARKLLSENVQSLVQSSYVISQQAKQYEEVIMSL